MESRIDPRARLGVGVEVGAGAIIEEDVRVGDHARIGPFCLVAARTIIGPHCELGPGCMLGAAPEDFRYRGEPTRVEIGRGNVLREYVTVHRATGRGKKTVVGDDNYLMAYVHVSHNCRVGSHTIITNACQLAGHVAVDDGANLGGMVGVHQFVRIGHRAMVGACSYVDKDLPPFLIGQGNPFRVRGVNRVGLERAGFTARQLDVLKEAYRILYRSELNLTQARRKLRQFLPEPNVRVLLSFLVRSPRGICLRT